MNDVNDVVKVLWPINCRYNFKIEKDGKCYSTECMFNVDLIMKRKIKKQGCKIFKSPEVQKELKND